MSWFTRLKERLFGQQTRVETPPNPEEEKAAEWERYCHMLNLARQQKDAEFRHSPYSPLPPETRPDFTGLAYYPPNADLRLTLPLIATEPREQITIQTNDQQEQPFERLGYVEFDVAGETTRLAVYRGLEQEALFIPFRDATSGEETYGSGRYLEPLALGGGNLLLDFNEAYNPYCAYSPDFSCPVPPFENWLQVPIHAGEKLPTS